MNFKLLLSIVLAIFVLLADPYCCIASGSYGGRPPKTPSRTKSQKYSLGKKIFSGKAKLKSVDGIDADQQKKRLTKLKEKLPEKSQKKMKVNLNKV